MGSHRFLGMGERLPESTLCAPVHVLNLPPRKSGAGSSNRHYPFSATAQLSHEARKNSRTVIPLDRCHQDVHLGHLALV